ncbi:MAG TPA: DUF4124 domain-containing protein [Steroidobacteraceae bacterium]|nr:DUF4124 domain-containing protein [Steroidobacteraceae bacterium]
MKRILLCAVLLGWSAMASAVVYKWVDAKGVVQYGDTPPDGVHATIVRLLGTRESGSAPPAKSAPANSAAAFANQALAADKTRQQQQAVDADVAAARQKQCAAAQAHYEQLINGRHMYTLGANGQRNYMSSAQIDAARMDAKQQADKLCNGGGST